MSFSILFAFLVYISRWQGLRAVGRKNVDSSCKDSSSWECHRTIYELRVPFHPKALAQLLLVGSHVGSGAGIAGRSTNLHIESDARIKRSHVGTAMTDTGGGLCLIDGHNLAYRMYFALGKTGMSTDSGTPTYALHGFVFKLLDLATKYPKHRLIVAFDSPAKTFRSEELPTYKSNRPKMPPSLRSQIDAMYEACECFGIPAVSAGGFEADDIIATCVHNAREEGDASVVIVSSDKDLLQLVSEEASAQRVYQWNDQKKIALDEEEVLKKFGVRPSQMGDFLALVGDSSDAIPGVPGVGPKTAAKLLVEHRDLESVLMAAAQMKKSKVSQSLIDNAEVARRALRCVKLRTDVPLKMNCVGGALPILESEKLDTFLNKWQLRKIKARIDTMRRFES